MGIRASILDKKSIEAVKEEVVLANEILKSIDDKNSRTFVIYLAIKELMAKIYYHKLLIILLV